MRTPGRTLSLGEIRAATKSLPDSTPIQFVRDIDTGAAAGFSYDVPVMEVHGDAVVFEVEHLPPVYEDD